MSKCSTPKFNIKDDCKIFSWEIKQEKTLSSYYKHGNMVAFYAHIEHLKDMGCQVNFEFNGACHGFRVTQPLHPLTR